MMPREHDYEDVLRRALHAAADLVEPSGDGLERIRARLTTPQPAVVAWVMAGYSDALRPALSWIHPLMEWLRTALSPVIERFKPAATDAAHPQRRYAWLRPAAAMGTAVFVVAMGAFALTYLPQVISSSGALVQTIPGGGSGGSVGSAGVNGQGNPIPNGPSASGILPPSMFGTSKQTPTCKPTKPAPAGSTTSPSPSTTPTIPPSTVSPSPTTTPTTPSTTPPTTPPVSPSPTTTDSSPAGATSSPDAAAPADGPAASGTPTPSTDVADVNVVALPPGGAKPSTQSSSSSDCKSARASGAPSPKNGASTGQASSAPGLSKTASAHQGSARTRSKLG